MTEGRPLRGDGIENLQDYVEERLTYGTDSDEFADANRTLQQQLADLQTLQQERGQTHARPNIDALIDEAQLRVDRMQQRSAGQIETGGGMMSDPDQLPPEGEARQNVVGRISGQQG